MNEFLEIAFFLSLVMLALSVCAALEGAGLRIWSNKRVRRFWSHVRGRQAIKTRRAPDPNEKREADRYNRPGSPKIWPLDYESRRDPGRSEFIGSPRSSSRRR